MLSPLFRVGRAIKYVVIFEKKLAYILYICSLFFQKNGFCLYGDKRDGRKKGRVVYAFSVTFSLLGYKAALSHM